MCGVSIPRSVPVETIVWISLITYAYLSTFLLLDHRMLVLRINNDLVVTAHTRGRRHAESSQTPENFADIGVWDKY